MQHKTEKTILTDLHRGLKKLKKKTIVQTNVYNTCPMSDQVLASLCETFLNCMHSTSRNKKAISKTVVTMDKSEAELNVHKSC